MTWFLVPFEKQQRTYPTTLTYTSTMDLKRLLEWDINMQPTKHQTKAEQVG